MDLNSHQLLKYYCKYTSYPSALVNLVIILTMVNGDHIDFIDYIVNNNDDLLIARTKKMIMIEYNVGISMIL